MESVVNPLKDFAKNSIRLVKRCTKPDRKGVSAVGTRALRSRGARALLATLQTLLTQWLWLAEFNKITVRTALGFIVMGFIGFFVKLIFIVSGSALCATPRCSLLTVPSDTVA